MLNQAKIAIVGVAAQIPSGDFSQEDLKYSTFWDFLLGHGQGYEALSPELFSTSNFGDLQEKLNLPAKGAFLRNPDGLDTIAFGISGKDARVMPFTARRLMELSFEALLDSGVDYRNQKIGCFMSGMSSFESEGSVNTDGSFASVPSALANRISYLLDITGPSVQIDTACSSSLTALHLAILAIEAGDCSAALVGAAQINRELAEWKNYVLGGVLSPSGTTKPFDAGADGFGRGEGVVVVVVKRLEDALRDNDHIHAVVVGSAINATGSRMPLNVPNAVAQTECIQKAYARAGKNATDVDYAELHVTGTSIGDPIESNGAGKIFARDSELVVGSVKGNVGHLEAAAFLVSLLKACLIIENKIIPPTVNLSKPSPAIDWQGHRLRVPTEPMPLGCRSDSGRSVVSVSAAGIGGSTGHVVIESPPAFLSNAQSAESNTVTFVVGALSPRAVTQICQSIRDADISDMQNMRACAVTLSRRARQQPWRTFFTMPFSSRAEIPPPTLVPTSTPPLAFIFSGQGPQNLEMGRRLFAEFPVFRSTILELDDVYRQIIGVSLLETTGLFVSGADTPSVHLPTTGWPVIITVASIAMLQMALSDLLKSVGVTPSSLAGHSAGETALLYTSGAGSKAMALEIAIARGQAMTPTESENEGMASLACNADVAAQIIARITQETPGFLELSCYNSPDAVSISGSAPLLAKAIDLAKAEGYLATRIATMVPGHSSAMDVIKDDYMSRMIDIFERYPGPHIPVVPVFSTCREQTLVDEFSPSYFWDNCRNPVRFTHAIANMLAFHADTDVTPLAFVEISCHAVLSSSILQHSVSDKSVVCPMRRTSPGKPPVDESTLFTETVARITLLGYNSCDFSGLYGPSVFKPSFIDHPFVFRSIPSPKTHFAQMRRGHTALSPLSTANPSINELTHPMLAQHVINGEPIMPATGFIEILLEAGANFLWDVEFMTFFSLSTRNSARMMLERSGDNWTLKSTHPGQDASITVDREHACGLMDTSSPVKTLTALDLQSIWERLPSLEIDGFYKSLEPLATFGPAYRRVIRCSGGPSEVLAEIQGPTLEESSDQYRVHPVALDACLHIMLHPEISKQNGSQAMYLPSKLDRFIYHGPGAAGNWFSHITRQSWSPDAKSYDIVVTDSLGSAICELRNLVVRKLTDQAPSVNRRLDLIFQPIAIPIVVATPEPTYSQRESQLDTETLFRILDSLAVKMISKSLEGNISVGSDVSRQRYFEFAKRALRDKPADSEVPADDGVMRTNYPDHFAVTERIAKVHETVFHSSKKAVDSLYSDDLMTRFYSRKSQTSTVYPQVVKSFSGLLDALRASGKRALNILEVGAGTGLLTKYLIDVLKQNPDLLAEYTVTDASYALAAELARNLAYDKVTPKIYDLEKPPSSQGLFPESYDVVCALHVLHAVPDINSCLSSLQSLLVPGGSLFVVELDGTSWETKAGSVWFDCIFGSFPEWFGFADGRSHCTMTPSAWMTQLEGLGFVNNHASIEGGDGGHNFLFTGQKATPFVDQDSSSAIDPRHVFRYSFGNEMDLRTGLAELSAKDRLEVYLVSLGGRDGDAAMGLIATLEREFPFWDIRLAIFESATHLDNTVLLISKHLAIYQKGERVLQFPSEGSPLVPRVVLSSAPPVLSDAQSISLPDSDHLVIEVIALEPTPFSVHGFVGRVVMSRRKSPIPGDFVAGITDQSKGTVLVVHAGCVVSIDAEQMRLLSHPGELVKLVAPILVLRCLPQRTASSLTVTVATTDETMSAVLTAALEAAGAVTLVQCDFKDGAQVRLVDAVISDLLTKTQYPHIRRWVPRSGRFILWDTLLRDSIRDASSEIARALETGLQRSPPINDENDVSRDLTANPATHSALFLHDKSYLLLGGIGGLGVDLAVWMYQRGARHIVLTSRKGVASLDPERDAEALSKIAYLQRCDDLVLRLEQCDGTDSQATSLLIESLLVPVAGCFQMTLVLSDALFLNQTAASFSAVHDGKIKVFEVFAAEVDITSLDFYVAFSSLSGLTGSPGQANYASACTVLDGILAHYPNAFSLVVPGVRDVGYLDRAASEHVDKANAGIFAVTISAARLWTFLEDGLQKIKLGSPRFNQYIPDLDWNAFHARLPLPAMFNHLLVPHKSSDATRSSTLLTSEEDILQIVLSLIEVEKEDFDSQRPLLSYGLDSLSATRLSMALQPFVSVSQVQLLAGVSWSELRVSLRSPDDPQVGDSVNVQGNNQELAREVLLDVLGIAEVDFDPNVPLIGYGLDSLSAAKLATALRPYLPVTQLQLLANTTWADLQIIHSPLSNPEITSLSVDNIVELRPGAGIPLIVFSGGDGSLAPLLALRSNFPGTLWGIQVTDTTPTDTFPELAAFYAAKIREKLPHGPYRIAAYSASSVISVAVVKLLEADGEEVRQLTFVDGFPGLWTNEETELLLREQEIPSLVDHPIASMIHMLKEDPLYTTSASIAQLEAALSGAPHAAQSDVALLKMTRRLVTPVLHFLVDFYPRDVERTYSSFADPFTQWYSSVSAPFSLLVAETGMITTLPAASRDTWTHLGAHLCPKSVEVHVVPGVGHYGILGNKQTAAVLEQWA